ncbi:hypothetical protein CEUSTIGMA_g8112.t1 [Chlamydomonas eustigma]|uniref:Guanylate cyclase domain-containing protein n=1 Tax=Chlamydomonas eustigma TaxID=1157962 RepID=A0A250XC59_9CHLO|nr:hypothetical protein CEUSTIGMA_g8112.t1 [Chlamydomonas eustigma]|eukprot:GAX80677.1 hypothetical protein CEUSTIGMA_g8112.t1 [Chlamydomonas eustigma]
MQLFDYVVLTFPFRLFTMFDYLVQHHNIMYIMKMETIGDCYIVAGGIIESDGQGFYQVRMPHNNEVFDIRIGIHTGDCVTGLVGTKLPKFSIYGDTMNTASRMESTGTVGETTMHASREVLPSRVNGHLE